MTVTIRRAWADDARGMAAVLNPIIAAGSLTSMSEAVTESEQRSFVESLPADAVIHVAIDEARGDLLGMQDVLPRADRPGAGDISTLVWLESCGTGVGQALASVTILAARELGYEVLRAVIQSGNARAVSFYRRLGFVDAAEDRAGCVVLELALSGASASGTLPS